MRSTESRKSALLFTLITLVYSIFSASGAVRAQSERGQIRHDGAYADSRDGDAPVREYLVPARELHLDPPGTAPEGRYASKMRPFDPLPLEVVVAGSLPEGDTPSGAAYTWDGAWIVVAHRDSGNLAVFDAAAGAFVKAVPLSGSPNDVALSSDGVHAVTANVFEDTASIVDLIAGAETAVVPVGDQPGVVRITPDGKTAVVGNTKDSDLSIIDIATATELYRIPDAGFVASVSFAFEPGVITIDFSKFVIAGNDTIVHPDYYNNRIQVFDIPGATAVTLPSDDHPRGIAVTPDGSLAVVTHTSSVQRISVIDVAAKTIQKTIDVGADLWGPVAVRPDGGKAAVAIQNNCVIVNLLTSGVSGSLPTVSVYDLLTTADGLYVLGVGYYGSLIDFSSEKIVKNLNSKVSTPVGAVSPVEPRAVLIANTFGEDMVRVNTNGASGFLEGVSPSGPPPEGDKARTMAVSPDGSKAVVANILSDNCSILDLENRSVEAIVDVGDRPAEVEITPDGSKAVVANLDSSFVSVIDLSAHAVTNINISTRSSQVEISPDGQYAYVAVVASGDGVWRINLNTLSVEGPKLPTGNMGSIGFLFWQSSGLTLSHDGLTLVTCDSFDDTVTLVDTAAWTVVTKVAVGDFPVRAAFSHDDANIYVTNRDDGTLKVVENAGPGSSVKRSINVGAGPFEMALSPAGDMMYLLNYNDKNVGVVQLPAGPMVAAIPLPDAPAGLALDGAGLCLYAATGNYSVTIGPGPAVSISMKGEFSVFSAESGSLVFQASTGLPPAMLLFNVPGALAAMPSPLGDGLVAVRPVQVMKF